MADESTSYSDLISRRRFVELTGVTGAAALAGCDGDGDSGTPTPTEEPTEGPSTTTGGGGGTEYPDQRHNGGTTVVPSDVQFNGSNTAGAPQIAHQLLFEKFAQYSYTEGGYIPGAISDWNFTGDAFEMTLREGLTWSDDSAVTGEDIAFQLRLQEFTSDPIWEWASGVEADGNNVTINVGTDVNPALVEFDVFERWARYPPQQYQDVYDALQESEDNLSQLTSKAVTDPVTNGPFQFEEAGDQLMLTSKFDSYPGADNINFGEYGFNYLGGGNQARQQALLSLDMDSEFSLFVPARIVADFPDAVEEVRMPSKWGFGLAPNHNRAFTGDRAVRQAISYVINREQVVQNAAPRAKQAPPIPTCITSADQERWLGDVWDDFETYGVGSSMTEEAAAVLEDAGYANVDGMWEDSEGNVVTLPITCPAGWSDWVLAAETCVDQLSSFGFDSTFQSTGNYWPVKNAGDFTLLCNGWAAGAPRGAYPYYTAMHQMRDPQVHDAKTFYPGFRDTEQLGGEDAAITVPSRTGSGTVSIHPGDKLSELATSTEDTVIQDIIVELAWLANVDLPHIPVAEKQEQAWLTDDDWALPENLSEDADANVQWPPTWLPRQGKMNYRG